LNLNHPLHGANGRDLEMLARVKKSSISSSKSTFDAKLSPNTIPRKIVNTYYLSQGIVDDVKGIVRTHKSLNFLVFAKATSSNGLFYKLLLVISCGYFRNELELHANLVPLLYNTKQLISLPLSINL